MAKPFLGLGDISPVLQGVGGGGGPHGMHAQTRHVLGNAYLAGIMLEGLIDAGGMQRFIQLPRLPPPIGGVISDRPEEGAA